MTNAEIREVMGKFRLTVQFSRQQDFSGFDVDAAGRINLHGRLTLQEMLYATAVAHLTCKHLGVRASKLSLAESMIDQQSPPSDDDPPTAASAKRSRRK